MKVVCLTCVFFLVQCCLFAQDEHSYPYTAEIVAHDVNVRAGSHLNYEIITQLNKGELVLVVGDRRGWKKIKMPEGALCWVSERYVKDNVVIGNRVNIRAGAGLKFNVLCQLNRDHVVNVKKISDDGQWLGIEPPEHAYAWIKKDFIKYKGKPEVYEAYIEKKQNCRSLFAQVERYKDECLKKKEDIPFDMIIYQYKEIIKKYPNFPEAKMAEKRIEGIGNLAKLSTKTRAADTPIYLTAKGKIQRLSKDSNRPGTHKLVKEGKWVCLLKSDTIELDRYRKKQVQIWGEQASSKGWSIPTINVKKIRLLD